MVEVFILLVVAYFIIEGYVRISETRLISRRLDDIFERLEIIEAINKPTNKYSAIGTISSTRSCVCGQYGEE
jgi:hypothetical protein